MDIYNKNINNNNLKYTNIILNNLRNVMKIKNKKYPEYNNYINHIKYHTKTNLLYKLYKEIFNNEIEF